MMMSSDFHAYLTSPASVVSPSQVNVQLVFSSLQDRFTEGTGTAAVVIVGKEESKILISTLELDKVDRTVCDLSTYR